MLNIAKSFYAAWNASSSTYDLPEAEITPIGTTPGEKRKTKTLSNKFTNSDEYDNIPLPGFTLYKTDRKHWGSLNQTWLVIDPRGYLVRITQENLEQILHVTGITEGLIQEKCVWARDNSATKMILVPVTSPLYIEAVKNTEMLDTKVDIKDVQIGDRVLLQNKLEGRYMGVLSLYGPASDNTPKVIKPAVHLRRQVVEVHPGKFHYQTDVKILKVLEKTTTPLDREESVEYINDKISTGIAYFTTNTLMSGRYYGNFGKVMMASTSAVPKPTLKFEEITIEEAAELFDQAVYEMDSGMLLLEKHNGKHYIVDMPFYTSSSIPATTSSSFITVRVETVKTSETCTELIPAEKRTGWGMSAQTSLRENLDSFAKYYKIVKCVKNDTYI